MLNLNIKISYPLCREWGEERMGGYSFKTEIVDGAKVTDFLRLLGDSNRGLQNLLSTPGGLPTGLVAVTLNNRKLQYRDDLQTQLRDKDDIKLALDYMGA